MASSHQQHRSAVEHSEIDFHRGNTLLKLANTYPSLMLTLIECIQNAIDGGADRIFVGIDLKSRRVDVADNGMGVDVFTFEHALGSVGQSIKESGKLGRFGLGLISPLNKCQIMTFTSAPAPDRRSNRWTFDTKLIKQQHEKLVIERVTIGGLPDLGRMFKRHLSVDFNVPWRTVVSMSGVSQDKVVSLVDLDELESETLSKLGNVMRSRSVRISVVQIDEAGRSQIREVTASDFSGEKLPVVHYTDPEAGEIEIELYRAPRRAAKRAGLVSVMESNNPSSISMRDFARQARMSRWKDEVETAIAALVSGYFEGTIRANKITMHPERTKFENDDALKALHFVLALWYDEHGKSQFDNEQEESRDIRYQELGLKSQQRFQDYLNRPEGLRLLNALRSRISFGRLGDGHVKPAHGRPNGKEEMPGTRVGQGGAGSPRVPSTKPASPQSRTPKDPGPDRPGDTPLGVLGPRGQQRRLVKGDSQGLWYEHSALPANSHLWEFDLELGVLTFNVRHPLWTRLDETKGKHTPRNAKQVMHLQEWLTLEVLQLLVMYPEPSEFEERRSLIDDKARLYVEMFISVAR